MQFNIFLFWPKFRLRNGISAHLRNITDGKIVDEPIIMYAGIIDFLIPFNLFKKLEVVLEIPLVGVCALNNLQFTRFYHLILFNF